MLKRVDRVRAEWAAGQAQAHDYTNSSNNNDSNSGIGSGSVNKSGGGRYSLVLLDEIGTGI